MPTTQDIEKLASAIGENIYIDVAKWHLYLSDAHLHTQVAEQLYPLLEEGNIEADKIAQVLQDISVKLGGGKLTASLADLIPTSVQNDLVRLLEEYQRQM
ncbi:DUF3181 family protein [Limnoraphis robusta Tam1]|jgi:hypothetical protein|uniref:DUF3181 family protein n=1 Tax=Limnoraphis robusta CCNP1315 TaxID=3110306 RepID=A0ABU5TZ29_9CYAN|nr:DUF3181 family protein [Limnoraphis robusta]MEA5501251.1 DUF3181 family protein [Limnoraphis robusta BA-68 BA1]MEA5520187.1 DUF3181 family protein [Limnoraphis robusta CCNP1315]MEA5539240.1 DUF3181 family protein [Limnoraphis robusta Tam1]MEA5546759.1 DUF3181 family protein [Limnoraphis robusta CCNP1324]